MGHNPATRDGKPVNRKEAVETRSADEIIKGIRGNLVSHLSITPTDIAFLLAQYDTQLGLVENAKYTVGVLGTELLERKEKIAELQSKIELLAGAAVMMYEQQSLNKPERAVGFTMTLAEATEADRVHELLQDNGEEFADRGGEA